VRQRERKITENKNHCLHLPSPGSEHQITIVLQTETSLEEDLETIPLPVERVDDIGSRLDKRRLEHVGQEREDRVEGLVLGLVGLSVGDSSHELGEDREIKDERSGEERVFTFVKDVLDVSLVDKRMQRPTMTFRPPIRSSE
jgi:hypothetical protein